MTKHLRHVLASVRVCLLMSLLCVHRTSWQAADADPEQSLSEVRDLLARAAGELNASRQVQLRPPRLARTSWRVTTVPAKTDDTFDDDDQA